MNDDAAMLAHEISDLRRRVGLLERLLTHHYHDDTIGETAVTHADGQVSAVGDLIARAR